jgi:hypothetical protein
MSNALLGHQLGNFYSLSPHINAAYTLGSEKLFKQIRAENAHIKQYSRADLFAGSGGSLTTEEPGNTSSQNLEHYDCTSVLAHSPAGIEYADMKGQILVFSESHLALCPAVMLLKQLLPLQILIGLVSSILHVYSHFASP